MNEFEQHLARRLREAAGGVAWRADREFSPAGVAGRTVPKRAQVVAAGLVAVLGLGGTLFGAIWLLTPNPMPEAQCANVLVWNDVNYRPHGEPLRVPAAGTALTPPAIRTACDDGNGATEPKDVSITRIKDLAPEEGFLAGGIVYTSDNAGPAAAALATELNTELPCSLTGPGVVNGQVLGILPPRAASSDLPSPPYILTFRATSGAGMPWDVYSALTIRVQITPTTDGVVDQREAIKRSLSEGAPLRLRIECDPSYTARSIRGN